MSARPGPCGGRSAMVVPTAIANWQNLSAQLYSRARKCRVRAILLQSDHRSYRIDRSERTAYSASGSVGHQPILTAGAVGSE